MLETKASKVLDFGKTQTISICGFVTISPFYEWYQSFPSSPFFLILRAVSDLQYLTMSVVAEVTGYK